MAFGQRQKSQEHQGYHFETQVEFSFAWFWCICWQNCSKNGFKILLMGNSEAEEYGSEWKSGEARSEGWEKLVIQDRREIYLVPDTREGPLQSSWWGCVVHYILQHTSLGGSLGCCWVCSALSYVQSYLYWTEHVGGPEPQSHTRYGLLKKHALYDIARFALEIFRKLCLGSSLLSLLEENLSLTSCENFCYTMDMFLSNTLLWDTRNQNLFEGTKNLVSPVSVPLLTSIIGHSM